MSEEYFAPDWYSQWLAAQMQSDRDQYIDRFLATIPTPSLWRRIMIRLGVA